MNLRRPLIVSAIVIAAMVCLSLAAATMLPTTVPLRFNAQGVATSYGSPYLPLALMPLAAVVLSGIFIALARSEPRRQNLAASSFAYTTRWIGAIAAVTLVHIWIVYTLVTTTLHTAAPINPQRLVYALVGMVIVIVGSQLSRVRSNFMIGIRTPWTLASDQVWDRTHRIARWPVIAAGLVIFAAAVAVPNVSILLALTSAIIIAVGAGLILLSYLIWRGDNAHSMGA